MNDTDIHYLQVQQRYSKAVVHNGVAHLAGQVADNPDVSFKEQTLQVLAQIEELLKACGSDKSRLLSAHVLLPDIRYLPDFNTVWDAWVVPGHFPTRTPFQALLASPAYLVEVQVTAAVGSVQGMDAAGAKKRHA